MSSLSSHFGQTRGPVAFCCHVTSSNVVQDRKMALPLVDVKIRVPCTDSYVDAYALLDSGSTHTLCAEDLLSTLRIEGRRKHVAISTFGGCSYDYAFRLTDLEVSGMYGHGELVLRGVHSKDSLPRLMGYAGTMADTEHWPHLNGLSIPQA